MIRFGVSRPTLREAIRILESEGLISISRGARGGASVLSPNINTAARHIGFVLQGQWHDDGRHLPRAPWSWSPPPRAWLRRPPARQRRPFCAAASRNAVRRSTMTSVRHRHRAFSQYPHRAGQRARAHAADGHAQPHLRARLGHSDSHRRASSSTTLLTSGAACARSKSSWTTSKPATVPRRRGPLAQAHRGGRENDGQMAAGCESGGHSRRVSRRIPCKQPL